MAVIRRSSEQQAIHVEIGWFLVHIHASAEQVVNGSETQSLQVICRCTIFEGHLLGLNFCAGMETTIFEVTQT